MFNTESKRQVIQFEIEDTKFKFIISEDFKFSTSHKFLIKAITNIHSSIYLPISFTPLFSKNKNLLIFHDIDKKIILNSGIQALTEIYNHNSKFMDHPSIHKCMYMLTVIISANFILNIKTNGIEI